MQIIDNNAYGILFIVDEEEKLRGCVTDGDIRRFLLSGGKMDATIIDATNSIPKIAKNKKEAEHLYHKRNYVIVPIVNNDNHIVALFPVLQH